MYTDVTAIMVVAGIVIYLVRNFRVRDKWNVGIDDDAQL